MKKMNAPIKILLPAVILLAAGCGILSKGGSRKDKLKVSGTFLIEEPACGANATTQSSTGVLANTTYYIKNGKMNNPDSIAFDQIDTGSDGRFTIYLKPGDYAIVHKDKLMNYGEFRLKYSSEKSTYFTVRDDDCFERWYKSADFLLHVESDTTVQLLVKSRCYIKTNPCIEYTGPK